MRAFYSSLGTNYFVKQVVDRRDGASLSTYSMIAFGTVSPYLLMWSNFAAHFQQLLSAAAYLLTCGLIVDSFDCIMGFDV